MANKNCPLESNTEWVEMKRQLGYDLAAYTYVKRKWEVPQLTNEKELSKRIGFTNKTVSENKYYELSIKLGGFNELRKNAHFLKTVKKYSKNGRMVRDVELQMNYLSIAEEQARRMMAANNPIYEVPADIARKEEEKKAKKETPSQVNPGYYLKPGDSNYTVRNGEVVNLADAKTMDDVDYLIPTAKDPIKDAEQVRKRKLQKEIAVLTTKSNNAKDSFVVRSLLTQIESLKAILEKADERIGATENIEKYDNVLQFADSQLNEIEGILSDDAISSENILYIERILNLWEKASNFKGDPSEHIILDEFEFQSDEIKKLFRNIGARVEDYQSRLGVIREEHVVAFMREYSNNKTLTKEEIFADFADSGTMSALTLNLGRLDDPILKVIFSAVEEMHVNARFEINEVFKDIDLVTSKALPKLKRLSGNKNPWRFYEQVTKDGLGTGKIVHRFSDDFFKTIKDLRYKAFYMTDKKGKSTSKASDVERYYKWLEENTITFDARKLFDDSHYDEVEFDDKYLFTNQKYSDAEKQAHINQLKAQLGEKGYTQYFESISKKIELFKRDRAVAWGSIVNDSTLSKEQQDALFTEWNIENSPFWSSELIENPTMRKKPGGKGFYKIDSSRKYTEQIPLRTTKSGKTTKWYDGNFEKIEADEDLLAYYNVMLNTLKDMRSLLPANKRDSMGITDIPKMKQSLADMFGEKGMRMGVKPFWERLQEMSKTTDLANTTTADIDPLTGERINEQSLRYIEDTTEKVNSIVQTKIIQHKQNTGTVPSSALIQKFKDEARNEVSQEYSFDLTKLLKAYSTMALEYKHKSLIEPQIKMLEKAFKSKKEIITNNSSKPVVKINSDGTETIQSKEGLANAKSALEFYLDTKMWGTGGRKVEGVSKKKTYTISEKKKKADLEALYEATSDSKEQEHLQSEIDKLGGFTSASGVGDMLLKLMTYKGLAYNLGSAFSNVGFGIISNLNEASDGRNYNMAQMRHAYLLTTNSIGKNLSGNKWDGAGKNALKIRTLMDKYDLLKTSDQEIYDLSTKSTLTKNLGRFGPMSLQQSSEYLNYAPVMVAMMMNAKATDPDGKETTLWDAIDENGELREGYSDAGLNESRFVLKVKRVIEMNHGDYNNQQQAKATITGRMLSQFRTWMFEGFANRFEKQKVDDILSYNNKDIDTPFLRKGRYRSYTAGQLATAGATLGTTFMPGIGTVLGGGAGFLIGKFAGMQTEESAINDTLFTLKQMARKLMFKPTQFQDRFNEVDAANMRKNMTELYMLMTIAGLGLLIAAVGGGEDDDERMSRSANFLLNQMTRLETDIAFYTNPLEFEKLTKTAVPMAQLVDDTRKWFVDVFNLFDGDPENDVFRSGIFKDKSKLLVHTGELIPGISTAIKLARSTSQVY